MPLKLKIELLS